MSFPQWGHSYNALYVPLAGGWHCALMPVRELPQVDRGWRLSYEERKRQKKERQEQISRDKKDFDRLFALRIDVKSARLCSEFREYVTFINRYLRASSWDLLDGEGITRVLCEAVREGHIIPVIARNWHGGQRVFQRFAPQRWPNVGCGSSVTRTDGANAPVGRFAGPFAAAMSVADKSMSSRLARSSRAFTGAAGNSSAGFDWLGAAGTVAEVVSGRADSNGNSGGNAMLKGFEDSDGGGSLSGDAAPFEYVPDEPGGDAFDLAASTNNPNFAAKMLGYDRDTFGEMIHAMKYNLDLRGDDNVIWHDSGDVEFRKQIIGNMHDYAN